MSITEMTEMTLRVPVRASTGRVGPRVHIVSMRVPSERVRVTRATVAEAFAHAQAMHELALLSFDTSSLERDLEDEINRNAWGITGA